MPTINGTSVVIGGAVAINRSIVQNISCVYSRIAAEGRYFYGWFNYNTKILLYQRKNAEVAYDIGQAELLAPSLIKDLVVSEDAKTLAVATSDKIYIYKNTSYGDYKIDSLFPHGFINPTSFGLFSNQDFSLLIALSKSTFNFFRFIDKGYELYQSMVFQ